MYLYFKALHIIFVVCWFAGLFYSVRLFVYYAEAQEKPATEKKILSEQYRLMIKRLWQIITWPSAVLATLFGVGMLIDNTALLQMPWMHIKLLFVLLLWIYHLRCQQFVQKISRDMLDKKPSFFRVWNEGATLILFSVVFLVVLKSAINWIFGVVGLLALFIALMIGYKWYKRVRLRKNKNEKF